MKSIESTRSDPSDRSSHSHSSSAHRYCAQCGYHLDGHATIGTCPECGQAYYEKTIQWRPLPSALEIGARFGWPVATYAVVLAVGMSRLVPELGGVLFLMGVFSFLSCYANIPLQMWLLKRSGVLMSGAPPATHDYWIAIMIVISLCAPVIVLFLIEGALS